MPNIVFVMSGGAIGAALRYGVARSIPLASASGWPTATFIANIAGGLAMGVLAAMLLRHDLGEGWRLFIGVGILGGFTTFSAFSLEVLTLLDQGRWGVALSYSAASVIGSVAALALGMALVRAS